MIKIETNLKNCYEVKTKRFGDERGYFTSITDEELKELGFNGFFQKSESLSCKGTLRGLHFQKDPYCQAKMVCCTKGAVLDVVVDCRKDSPTYGQYTSVKLTPEDGNYLYVPRGFAHGFLALTDDATFNYMVDNQYKPSLEGGIAYNDPEVNIPWEEICSEYGIDKIILSDKDKNRVTLKDNKDEFFVKPKRHLITGVKGQLGYDIVRELHQRGEYDILAIDVEDMDITNREQVMEIIKSYNPDVIYHCAAWTAVDKAEDQSELVHKVNVAGTKNITDASIEVGAKLIYMSTDYVFDGKKDINTSYVETDDVNPMSVYGQTKYLGEEEVRRNPNHFITRISWVFGVNGNNFIKTMLRLSKSKSECTVVDDQIGSPTYTVDLAKLLVEMAYTDKYGTYNVNNEGYCSWAEFAEYIMNADNRDMKIIPVSTEEYIRVTGAKQAFRPRNSKLSKDKLEEAGFSKLPTWQDATDRYVKELRYTKDYKLGKF